MSKYSEQKLNNLKKVLKLVTYRSEILRNGKYNIKLQKRQAR